jgi:hypothetical protein
MHVMQNMVRWCLTVLAEVQHQEVDGVGTRSRQHAYVLLPAEITNSSFNSEGFYQIMVSASSSSV